MLVIRLARGGRTKYPVYRIVAAESTRAATGKFVEVLGHYNPHTKDLVIKKEETELRLSHGAQPSNSVVKLLMREGIELPKWVKLKTKEAKKSDEPEVAEEVVAGEAPADDSGEAPADDTPAEAPAEEPAPEGDERVAIAATENDAEVSENTSEAPTETAETTEEQAEKAEAANEAGAKVVAEDK